MSDQNNVNYRPPRKNKAPVYTSDKRAKFTQRANKHWVRLATVFGYMIAVSMPAVVLSVYYTCFWDPNYAAVFNKTNKSIGRYRRELGGPTSADSLVRPIEAPPTIAPSKNSLVQKEDDQCLPCVCNSMQSNFGDNKVNGEEIKIAEKKAKLADVLSGGYDSYSSNQPSYEYVTASQQSVKKKLPNS